MIPDSVIGFYSTIPYKINPIAFSVGFLKVQWYPLMYIAAFLTVYLLLRWRIRNGEFPIKSQIPNTKLQNVLEEFILYSFWGVIIGGRLGYVLFYNFSYYWNNPIAIISPFDAAGKFIGIYGMSYHGGFLGVLLATWYFIRKNKIRPPAKKQDKNSKNNILGAGLSESSFGEGVNFFSWADFAVPAIPAGFFFGRIGNFLNGELYGRITTSNLGMYFPAGGEILRHPSQLYEAFFEGLILFIFLWALRNSLKYKNKLFHVPCSVLYIFLYGLFRFFLEFFREPDPQLGFLIKWAGLGLTMGQILSLGMIILALCATFYFKGKPVYNAKQG